MSEVRFKFRVEVRFRFRVRVRVRVRVIMTLSVLLSRSCFEFRRIKLFSFWVFWIGLGLV